MANSDKAIDRVLKVEGGYVDHPNDPGGATKYGVTQKTLDNYHLLQSTYGFPVSHLTLYEARTIYKKMYWDNMRLDETDNDIAAYLVFDQAVNQGLAKSVQRFQEAYNYTMPRETKLAADGVVGPKTLAGMDKARRGTHVQFIKMSQVYYASITAHNPTLTPFIRGWIIRTHHLWDVVNGLG